MLGDHPAVPPADSLQEMRHDFQLNTNCTASAAQYSKLGGYVTGPDARAQTAYAVELTPFRLPLALGDTLSRPFFVTRAAVRLSEPVVALDGTPLRGSRSTAGELLFRLW